MVSRNALFCHHFFQIVQTESIRQVLADTPSNNIDGVMQTSERFSDK